MKKSWEDKFKLSVVKIIVDNIDFDWFNPYKTLTDYQSTGTGFFIDDKGTILTCFHVIEGSIKIWVTIPELGRKRLEATVLSICPHSDIALLRVKDYKNKGFLELVKPDDQNLKEVYAVGYPLGSDNIKMSKGIISGMEGYHIQIDAPINQGNSGGPLIQNCDTNDECGLKVIGINSSKVRGADNIGYAIPTGIFMSIKDLMYKSEKIIHKPELLCWFTKSNEFTLEYLETQETGIYISHLVEDSPLTNLEGITEGDILCSFDNNKIDNFGECLLKDMKDRIPLVDLLQYYKIGEEIEIIYWDSSNKLIKKEKIILDIGNNYYKIRKKFPAFENIDYEIVAGMVIMELTINHIELLKKTNFSINDMIELATYQRKQNRFESVLFITHVFPGSFISSTETISGGCIIIKVNNENVNSLKTFRKAFSNSIKKNGKAYFILETNNYDKIIVDLDKIFEEEKFLAKKYNFKLSDLKIGTKKYSITYS